MRIYLAATSALRFWRGAPYKHTSEDRFELPDDFIPSVRTNEAEWTVAHLNQALPLVSAVARREMRRNGKKVRCFVHTVSLPQQEYQRLGMDTFVASPELTLAQMARWFSTPGYLPDTVLKRSPISSNVKAIVLAALMTEFCGEYYVDSTKRDGCAPRAPLTDLAKLADFLERAGNFSGRKLFEQALALSFDGSRSPAETNLVLLETLKFSMGGMSFSSRPTLNAEIKTSRSDCAHKRYADQLFADGVNEIVEYNGGRHEGERANDDDRRRTALRQVGYLVTVVNSDELMRPLELEQTLSHIRDKVGTTGRRPADYAQRRAHLRALLFELSGTKCWENRGILPATLHPPLA